MSEIWYMLSGKIPGGFTLVILLLLVSQAAWWFTVHRNREAAKYRAVKTSIWILIGWLTVYLVLRYFLPNPVLPIRIAVVPLAGPEQPVGMGQQLAREIEEGIASTNPRWSVGAFRRMGRNISPVNSLPDSERELPGLLALEWMVSGEWKPVSETIDQIEIRVKLHNIETGIAVSFSQAGTTNQVLEAVADKIAETTGKRKNAARVAPMSHDWRVACAQSILAKPGDATVIANFESAYRNDSLAISGFAWMLQYRLQNFANDTGLARMEPAMLRLLHFAESNPLYLISTGEYYRRKGDVEKAAAGILLAHGYAPASPEPHYYLSLMSPSQTGTRFQKTAEAHAARAVELDPGYEKARLRLLEFLPPNPLRKTLFSIVEPGLQINPDSPQLLLRKAFYQLSEVNPKEVLSTLNRVITLDSTLAAAYYNRGIAHLRISDTTESLKDFRKCWSMGGTVESLYYLGHIYEGKAEIDSAIYYYNLRYKFADRATDTKATLMARGKLVNLLQKRSEPR